MQRRNFLLASTLALALPLAHAATKKTKAAAPTTPALITVYKSPTCGCCAHWIEHLQEAGFETKVINSEDMDAIKLAQRVPNEMMSCHTGVVDGYFIEGHVPAEDIKKLLTQRPKARGLAVPGMPMGSPGMEMEGHVDVYSVYLVQADGSADVYSHH